MSYGRTNQNSSPERTNQKYALKQTKKELAQTPTQKKIVMDELDVCELDPLSRKRVLSFIPVTDREYFGWMLVSKQW